MWLSHSSAVCGTASSFLYRELTGFGTKHGCPKYFFNLRRKAEVTLAEGQTCRTSTLPEQRLSKAVK